MITLEDIQRAEKIVSQVARHTPVMTSPTISALCHSDLTAPDEGIFLKAENLQKTGSFKIRGAYWRLSQLSKSERDHGVVAASAGNHAQGLALAARLLGVTATVFMPETASIAKIQATKGYGATVILEGRTFDEAVIAAKGFQKRANAVFVSAYDDDAIITGQGTLGLEILEDLPDVDAVVAGFGGGGLSCGIASALKESGSKAKVFAAEPETAAPLAYSLGAGSAQYFPNWKASFVDGCGGKSVFPRMWDIAHHLLAGSIVVTLEEIRQAMRIVAMRNHVIAEGAGACAVAAGLSGKCGSGTIVCVVSGGNIDLAVFSKLVSD